MRRTRCEHSPLAAAPVRRQNLRFPVPVAVENEDEPDAFEAGEILERLFEVAAGQEFDDAFIRCEGGLPGSLLRVGPAPRLYETDRFETEFHRRSILLQRRGDRENLRQKLFLAGEDARQREELRSGRFVRQIPHDVVTADGEQFGVLAHRVGDKQSEEVERFGLDAAADFGGELVAPAGAEVRDSSPPPAKARI